MLGVGAAAPRLIEVRSGRLTQGSAMVQQAVRDGSRAARAGRSKQEQRCQAQDTPAQHAHASSRRAAAPSRALILSTRR